MKIKRLLAVLMVLTLMLGIMPMAFADYSIGDVDRNGKVGNTDIVLLARSLVNLDELDDEQRTLADFNTDGSITNEDLVILARILVGIPYQGGQPTDEPEVVQTTAGKVRGTVNNGVYQYLGIPYAEATERFVPAGVVTPWEGIRDANEYGESSPQAAILGGGAPTEDNGSNNCQNLNIWTAGTNDGGKRPVMVWLHGGGFSSGTANSDEYNGTNLAANQDVVVVGVNHRLNLYGYLDLSAYGEKYKYSANVGTMDIVAALEWIEANIEAFGGDPNNITVFGQSGGGAKVLALMTSPYAKGHFQKGIVQSGATETMGVSFTTQEQSTALTQNILERLGLNADNIENIQTISNADLQTAASEALAQTAEQFQIPQALGSGYAMEWGPVIDGDYMPTQPLIDGGFAEAGKDVPLLIGSNLNEWSFMAVAAQVTDEIQAAYEAAYPNEDPETAGQVDSTIIRLPMLKIMTHKAEQGGANVYAYVFTYQVNMGFFNSSYHGAEIPFVFNNAEGALSDTVSAAWASFARNGVPSADALPEWEAYTIDGGATMILDEESYLAHHHDRELMHLLNPQYDVFALAQLALPGESTGPEWPEPPVIAPETPGSGPADRSNITQTAGVPMVTLNNGVEMPRLGLGTQIQRLENDASEEGRKLLNDTSHDAVVAALQAGYRHLDTAHGYYNERGVGQGIIDSGVPREEIWVTSKLWPSEYANAAEAIDQMLERLQLDYIDCVYLHHPVGDYMTAYHALEDAYRAGKIRAIGISNFDNWMEAFNRVMTEAEIMPQIMQIECHPFAQRLETRMLAAYYNMQVECWYPLGHADDRLLNDDVLSAIAEAHGKSVVQIILRWHMQEGFSAVPGSTNPDHIQENISIFDFELTDEEMAQIRAIDRGEEGRYFNINYELMGAFFMNLNE